MSIQQEPHAAPTGSDRPDGSWGRAWRARIAERRTRAARLTVLGCHAGVVGGMLFPVFVFAANELLERGSSTSVLALLAMPVVVPLSTACGTTLVGVLTWAAARVLTSTDTVGDAYTTRQALQASGWLGVAGAALAATAALAQ